MKGGTRETTSFLNKLVFLLIMASTKASTKKEGDGLGMNENMDNKVSDKIMNYDRITIDTSALIEGFVSKKVRSGELVFEELILHEAVLAELEHQANQNKAIGFLGLDEIETLRKLGEEKGFTIRFSGRRPTPHEIRNASLGEIDALIRDLAFDEGACLVTGDKVQARLASAKGIPFILFEPVEKPIQLLIEEFFDQTTMSVHLREGTYVFAKKGSPGNWDFTRISNKKLTREEVQDYARNIIEVAGTSKDGFIEIDRPGSTIVQINSYRIVITRPPFSDGWEITAVRPVKKLSLDDYELSEKLKKRIAEQAEGILIAGSPGHGKSTFAQALAEFYASKGKIVKTIEAPRDLVLPDEITQYAISHGTPQEVHDILLLSRPDYTIFDEMRNSRDFELFADLRLAGIGLAGVVHATNPIDAVQRFIGRIELGVIPHVIDTVIFIKEGRVAKVLSLKMVVKVPSGMTEADLARPVVVVEDFETEKLEFEIYSYGEETVVVPVKAEINPLRELAARSVEDYFRRFTDNVEVEFLSDNKCVVYLPSRIISKVIGKQGKNIEKIEKELGVSIDIQELTKKPSDNKLLRFDYNIGRKSIIFRFKQKFADRDVDIFIDDDFVMNARISSNATLKITKKNKIGRLIEEALDSGRLRIVLRD